MKTLMTCMGLLFLLQTTVHEFINQDMESNIQKLEERAIEINEERQKELIDLSKEVYALIQEKGSAKLNFVCTHNSRRSQLSQVWLAAAAKYYGIENISSYSGGTESTAFNHRMVAALQRFGFDLKKQDDSDNPKYLLDIDQKNEDSSEGPMVLFSKKYGHTFNPQAHFIAVMVCTQADEACPIVEGAYSRVALPYVDPKRSDNTPDETLTYDKKVEEIGIEILYMVKELKDLLEK